MKYKLRIKKGIVFTLIMLFQILEAQTIHTEIKLPAIVASNMVLQRNTTIEIWGWSAAHENIEIEGQRIFIRQVERFPNLPQKTLLLKN